MPQVSGRHESDFTLPGLMPTFRCSCKASAALALPALIPDKSAALLAAVAECNSFGSTANRAHIFHKDVGLPSTDMPGSPGRETWCTAGEPVLRRRRTVEGDLLPALNTEIRSRRHRPTLHTFSRHLQLSLTALSMACTGLGVHTPHRPLRSPSFNPSAVTGSALPSSMRWTRHEPFVSSHIRP